MNFNNNISMDPDPRELQITDLVTVMTTYIMIRRMTAIPIMIVNDCHNEFMIIDTSCKL